MHYDPLPALMLAVVVGYKEIVRLLLNAGADCRKGSAPPPVSGRGLRFRPVTEDKGSDGFKSRPNCRPVSASCLAPDDVPENVGGVTPLMLAAMGEKAIRALDFV
jgi:ankyrin repeat protein